MKKFVLALMFLMSTVALSFAGTINYYNQTDQTIQMLRDGVPPGIGSNVIPNGFYSETVGYGTYLLQATNGQQTTAGYSCTIGADNDRCDYTVSIRESYAAPRGAKVVNVTQINRNDWTLLAGGPFNREGVAPYNVYYSPSTLQREDGKVGLVFEAVPTDGTPTRYSVVGINCRTNQYVSAALDNNGMMGELSALAPIAPNTVMSNLSNLFCR